MSKEVLIKDTLKNAIRSLSKKHQIKESELRIKVSKPDNKLKCEIMKNADVLEEVNVATALNLNSVTAFLVGNNLNTIIDSLSKNYQVPLDIINVRIYTRTENCEPNFYLFDGKNALAPLDIDKLI